MILHSQIRPSRTDKLFIGIGRILRLASNILFVILCQCSDLLLCQCRWCSVWNFINMEINIRLLNLSADVFLVYNEFQVRNVVASVIVLLTGFVLVPIDVQKIQCSAV